MLKVQTHLNLLLPGKNIIQVPHGKIVHPREIHHHRRTPALQLPIDAPVVMHLLSKYANVKYLKAQSVQLVIEEKLEPG